MRNCLCTDKQFAVHRSPYIILFMACVYAYIIGVISPKINIGIILLHDKFHSERYFHNILC